MLLLAFVLIVNTKQRAIQIPIALSNLWNRKTTFTPKFTQVLFSTLWMIVTLETLLPFIQLKII